MITEDYVSVELAQKLKDKGFDVPCYTLYDIAFPKDGKPALVSSAYCVNHNGNPEIDMIMSAPTLSLVTKWLREEKKIFISIHPEDFDSDENATKYGWECWINKEWSYSEENESYLTYEDALIFCIDKALELL